MKLSSDDDRAVVAKQEKISATAHKPNEIAVALLHMTYIFSLVLITETNQPLCPSPTVWANHVFTPAASSPALLALLISLMRFCYYQINQSQR